MDTDIRPVVGPQVWRGADMTGRTDWVHTLPQGALGDLDGVVRNASARNLTPADFDFEATDIPAYMIGAAAGADAGGEDFREIHPDHGAL